MLLLLTTLACDRAPAPKDLAPDDSEAAPPAWGLSARPENPDCLAVAPPVDQDASVQWERAWPELGFNQLTAIVPVPLDPPRVAVVEQTGAIYTVPEDEAVTEATPLLTLSAALHGANEAGLLGLAFHPSYAENGHAYVSYVERREDGEPRSVIARYTSADGGLTLDPDSELRLLTLDQTGGNHNGGRLAFLPDGTLLIGFGDGGGSGRKYTAQDPNTWFGSFLRVDVDGGSPYAVPPDNPWIDGDAPEVWAIGLRNPWGWDIDPLNGDVLAGDVGWDSYEEIDLIERGGNYGWVYYEGPQCTAEDECFDVGQVEPLYAYAHDPGNCVIGGVVYRGSAPPELDGAFLFTDLADHALRALTVTADGEVVVDTLLADAGLRGAAFGRDAQGEVLFGAFNRSGEGGLYRLVRAGEPPAEDPFPATLSATGCEDGTIPYFVNAPFWADGADKERWMALPDGASANVDAEGALRFPVGSVLGKTFSKAGRRVETRLLMQREEGVWDGYAYVWDEAGEVATLATGAVRLEVGGEAYRVPPRHECGQCHPAGPAGLSVGQLLGAQDYEGGVDSEQLATLAHIGALEIEEAWFSSAPLPSAERDARAWLHTNCSSCHQPGTGVGDLDLRYATPLAETGACDVPPQTYDLGLEDARLIAPGEPARSALLQRLSASETLRMPPIGPITVDTAGVALVEAWITGLQGCD